MKLADLTIRERIESMFLVSGMSFLLYTPSIDFKLILFIVICFAYLLDQKVKNRQQFEQLQSELRAELTALKSDSK